MTFPAWLDPTPLTRAFVGSFANDPVREPFVHLRKATQNDPMPSARSFAKVDQLRGSARGGQKMRTKAQEDARLRGETMEMRRLRQGREYYARSKQKAHERYLKRKAVKAISNALRVGGTGEESSSPGGRP